MEIPSIGGLLNIGRPPPHPHIAGPRFTPMGCLLCDAHHSNRDPAAYVCDWPPLCRRDAGITIRPLFQTWRQKCIFLLILNSQLRCFF